jgi:FAD/FMN-containing dehydrogenase
MNVASLLSGIVGDKYFSTDPAIIEAYRDTLFPVDPPRPFGVILPETTEEVVDIVKLCNEIKMPIVPIAVGAPINGMNVCIENGLVMDLSRMNKILDIDPDTMVAVIEPGVTIGQMIKALEPYNLMTSYPNSSPPVSVLANIIFLKGSGQHITKFGTADYYLQGVEAVMGTGKIVKTGSGALDSSDWHFRYCLGPDLSGLFVGSLGTMGIVTKGAVKLAPIAERTWSVALGFNKIQEAVKPINFIGKYRMVDYINGQYWYTGVITDTDYPWEVTGGKAALPLDYMDRWRESRGLTPVWFHLAIEGSEREVEVRRQILEEYIDREGLTRLDMSHDGWYHVRDVQIQGTISSTAARFCRHRGGGWSSLVFIAPIKKWGDILDPVIEKGREFGFDPTYLLKVFGPYAHTSQCRFVLSYNKSDPDERERAKKFTREFTLHAVKNGGVIHRQTLQPDLVMQHQPEYFELLKQIKNVMDPNCILNRGVLGLRENDGKGSV